MSRLKIKFFIPLFLLGLTHGADAQIAVPDYSFTGKEITEFTVTPGYTAINFDFKLPSKMDVYLQKRESELNIGDKKDYNAAEPGIMYSSPSSASFSSIFVGPKAFRNNIVKMYLQKNYIDAIKSYEKFAYRLENSEYSDESKLLYGLSLYETGNQKEAVQVLTELSSGAGEFPELAQDSLFTIADRLNKFDLMESVAYSAPSLSSYSFGIWLKNLYSRNHYDAVLNYLNKYPSYENDYPVLTDLRLTSLYFLKKYEEASQLAEKAKGMASYPLAVDSFIMMGKIAVAEKLAKDVEDSAIKNVLLAKIDISKDNFSSATAKIKNIQTDNEKLALLLYAVSAKFKDLPYEFLSEFKFKDKQNNDYMNFYLGLKYLSDKRNSEAVNKLALVAFNKDLIRNAYFYQGMSAAPIDRSRSEWNFNKYIGVGEDNEKIMLSKFMLAQIYFLDKKNDDALMLIDDCTTEYCTRLKADIMLADNKFGKSIELTKGLNDDRSLLIKANAYYNLKDYDKAINELKKIKNSNADSEYLLMMSLFKTKKLAEAENILKNNASDKRIMSAGVEQLILAGAGETALAYIDKSEDLSPEYRLERAKLLLSAGRIPEAETAFKGLIASNMKVYDALEGLFDIARLQNRGKEFVSENRLFLEKSANFDNKDSLVSKFAAYAADAGEHNLAIGYVNYFSDNFKNSAYMSDIQKTRAKLFKFTGLYAGCVEDADAIIAKGGVQAEDALYLKGECLEYIDKAKALGVYRTMFSENNRFFQPAATKLAELSDNPAEILSASQKIRQISPETYDKGAVRFLEKAGTAELEKYKDDIYKMSATDTDKVRAAALWRLGQNFNDNKNYTEAAKYFLKSYYLFPKSEFAAKNLEGVKKSYEARGLEKETAKADAMLRNLNKDNATTKKITEIKK